MKLILKPLAPALVLLAAPAAFCVTAPAAIAAAAHSPEAVALVALLTPSDMVSRIAGSAFDKGLAEQPAAAQQEFAAHPGMKEFVAARVRARMTAILNAELPDLRDQLATRVEAEMTPDEMREVRTFFESSTGTRMRKTMYDYMVAHPPMPGHEDETTQAAVAEFMKTLTADDYPVLMAFGSSGGAAKLKTLNPEISELGKRWGEDTMKAHAGEFTAIAASARQEFLARPKGS